jgi:hypothetical protein
MSGKRSGRATAQEGSSSASSSAPAAEIRRAHDSLQHNERQVTAQNNSFINERHNGDAMEVEDLPFIVQQQIVLAKAASAAAAVDVDEEEELEFRCAVKQCQNNLDMMCLEDLLEHHEVHHSDKTWRKDKCDKYGVMHCAKCRRFFIKNAETVFCQHLAGQNVPTNPHDLYMEQRWSITIVAVKTDVPVGLLGEYNKALDSVGCKVAIACLERGDKENNLHVQSAAEICWNPDDGKGLAKYFRTFLQVDTKYADLNFKMQCKLFDPGQTWLGMIGYCQKWRAKAEYKMIHRGMVAGDLLKGQVHHTVYRSDYTKDKFVVDNNNILKASYAHWTAVRKPVFVKFAENMYDMLQTGDYVISGKLLSGPAMDRARTEEAWATLLNPNDTSIEQVCTIFFGSVQKTVQSEATTKPRYDLSKYTPSAEDATLIPFLQHHMVKRRENIVLVGAAGCGKSCLIQTLTLKHGVQYFGTSDELREVADDVEFVVFDDFDFSSFTCDDIKRLLDREMDTQRVRVRYKDAQLTKTMTRIILCNSIPECLEDEAVRDRYVRVDSVVVVASRG